MITNALLDAKYAVQRRLDEEAAHDLSAYALKAHEVVRETEERFGLRFTYGQFPPEQVTKEKAEDAG